MVTPTFAAGLGVVIAAAIGMPTPTVEISTQPGGIPCRNPACGPGTALATGPKAQRLTNPRHKHDPVQSGGSVSVSGSGSGSGILVEYQPTRQDRNGNLIAQLVLIGRSGRALPSWTLRFGYPAGQIRSVWGGFGFQQLPPGTHTATVSSRHYNSAWSGSRQADVLFDVSGATGRPPICTVNGQSCVFTSGVPSHGGGYSGERSSQTGQGNWQGWGG